MERYVVCILWKIGTPYWQLWCGENVDAIYHFCKLWRSESSFLEWCVAKDAKLLSATYILLWNSFVAFLIGKWCRSSASSVFGQFSAQHFGLWRVLLCKLTDLQTGAFSEWYLYESKQGHFFWCQHDAFRLRCCLGTIRGMFQVSSWPVDRLEDLSTRNGLSEHI